MKEGQQHLGTVSQLAIQYGCYEQLMDGITILYILAKRKIVKGLNGKYPQPDTTKVYVSNKMTKVGGHAYYKDNYVVLNEALAHGNTATLKAARIVTLLHEYAHIVAYQLYRSKGHDNSWRYVMDVLDLPPNMYHSNVEDFAAHRAARSEREAGDFFDELLD